jgi:hypothetical protein
VKLSFLFLKNKLEYAYWKTRIYGTWYYLSTKCEKEVLFGLSTKGEFRINTKGEFRIFEE